MKLVYQSTGTIWIVEFSSVWVPIKMPKEKKKKKEMRKEDESATA